MCTHAALSERTLLTVLACIGAVAVYAVAVRAKAATATLIWIQAALAAAVGAAVLFVFSESGAVEAHAVPYRHLFAVLAPAILIALAFAPPLAALILRPTARGEKRWRIDGISAETRSFFQKQFRNTELFEDRDYPPPPEGSHVCFALIRGVIYRIVPVLLPPALLALVAPADWLIELAAYGFVASLFLTTWGTMSQRWAQMNRHVDRWFLSGTALFISIFVIVIGALRVAGVDYVTTIIDPAPFGVLFAIVAMSYVLSWLFEYWVNRMVAGELIAVLGGDSRFTSTPYTIDFDPVLPVQRKGRELAYHGLGRFLVLGTLSAGHRSAGQARAADTAFNSHDLLELFRKLAGNGHDSKVGEVVRYTNLYFYAMNAILLAVFLGFGVTYWCMAHETDKLEAVVSVPTAQHADALKDLTQTLIAKDGENRPAVVVIGSGGGTRAALYTSHVLQGLHQLGAARDIVLMSGVSGGGVALAYFAAHYGELTAADGEPKSWTAFREAAAKNLIGDVLEGASELRIFGRTPLSMLLAESMERNMLSGAGRTMALPDSPPLILNTAITGHPADDSEVLMRTLASPRNCRETEQPYNMMSGGRLVFTNVMHTGAFPAPRVDPAATPNAMVSATQQPPIPNTRLPYWVVKDPGVSLARAATLNANFPPVFPNARVVIDDYQAKGCPRRSYFVTDGGAQENLGLVSALYAVQSALLELKRQCNPKCALRPLDFVLAEASGAGYDYAPDRGISAAFGAAKDRLTGGLTNALIDETRALYASLGANPADIRFHYLPLPLAFRARGGFGTHWMHADRFELRDPRAREVARGLLSSAKIDREELAKVWLALHRRDHHLCSAPLEDGSITTDKVRRWICGVPSGVNAGAHDLHIDAWKRLVETLGR